MNTSTPSVTENCELTYIQLAAPISQCLPVTQVCTVGSMNRCSVRSIEIRSRACWKDSGALPSTAPRTKR